MKTPLLFIIFNRPDTVRIVFNLLQEVKPEILYIASDAPRENVIDDVENCNLAREIVKDISWDCKVKYNYFDRNHGTKYGPAKAISWFFSEVEEGIILEHDCLPNIAFFDFCEKMLEKYRNTQNVMHVNGSNFLFERIKISNDYLYSNIPLIWGWATWKRAWQFYDVDLKNISINQLYIPGNFLQKRLWIQTFKKVQNNEIATWDYQWTFTLFLRKGLSITPSVNLVSNIGFGEKATFGKNLFSKYSNVPTKPLVVLSHPDFLTTNVSADRFLMKTHFNMNFKHFFIKIIKLIINKIYK